MLKVIPCNVMYKMMYDQGFPYREIKRDADSGSAVIWGLTMASINQSICQFLQQ